MKTTDDINNEHDRYLDAIVTLVTFLSHAADDGEWYGGHSGEEALTAMQALLGWDDELMKNLVQKVVYDV